MPRHREFDDETVVLAARDLFWERGYAATSLTQLQAATGLSRSSLYEAYGSKRGLYDRAVRSYLAEVLLPLLTPLEQPHAGSLELAAYFRSLADLIRSAPAEAMNRGCLLVNATVELDEPPDAVTELAAGYCVRLRAAVHTVLSSASAVEDAGSRADMVVSSQLGLLAVARLNGPMAAAMAEKVADDISSW